MISLFRLRESADTSCSSVRGSVITPVSAEAAAVSGLHQINLVLLRARAAGEIARHGAQADPAGRRRLAHADATVAAGLVDPRAGVDERAEHARRRSGSPGSAARSG